MQSYFKSKVASLPTIPGETNISKGRRLPLETEKSKRNDRFGIVIDEIGHNGKDPYELPQDDLVSPTTVLIEECTAIINTVIQRARHGLNVLTYPFTYNAEVLSCLKGNLFIIIQAKRVIQASCLGCELYNVFVEEMNQLDTDLNDFVTDLKTSSVELCQIIPKIKTVKSKLCDIAFLNGYLLGTNDLNPNESDGYQNTAKNYPSSVVLNENMGSTFSDKELVEFMWTKHELYYKKVDTNRWFNFEHLEPIVQIKIMRSAIKTAQGLLRESKDRLMLCCSEFLMVKQGFNEPFVIELIYEIIEEFRKMKGLRFDRTKITMERHNKFHLSCQPFYQSFEKYFKICKEINASLNWIEDNGRLNPSKLVFTRSNRIYNLWTAALSQMP